MCNMRLCVFVLKETTIYVQHEALCLCAQGDHHICATGGSASLCWRRPPYLCNRWPCISVLEEALYLCATRGSVSRTIYWRRPLYLCNRRLCFFVLEETTISVQQVALYLCAGGDHHICAIGGSVSLCWRRPPHMCNRRLCVSVLEETTISVQQEALYLCATRGSVSRTIYWRRPLYLCNRRLCFFVLEETTISVQQDALCLCAGGDHHICATGGSVSLC